MKVDKKSWQVGYEAGLRQQESQPENIEVLSWHAGVIEGQAEAKIKIHQEGHAKPVFINDKNGKPDLTPKKKIELSEHKCPSCGKPLIKRESKKNGKGGNKNYWWGCSGFPDCRETYFEDNGKPKFKESINKK